MSNELEVIGIYEKIDDVLNLVTPRELADYIIMNDEGYGATLASYLEIFIKARGREFIDE